MFVTFWILAKIETHLLLAGWHNTCLLKLVLRLWYVNKSISKIKIYRWKIKFLIVENQNKFKKSWKLFSKPTWKTSFRYLGHCSLKYLKTIALAHYVNVYVTGNQFKLSISSLDICVNPSNCKQKLMYLFWVVWILCFNFFVRFEYHAEHS